MFDAAQCVLERVQRGRLAVVSLLRGEVELQLFQNFKHLLLVLGFGRLLTAARRTITGTRTAASQTFPEEYMLKKENDDPVSGL